MNITERQEIQSKYPNVEFPDPVLEPLWWGRRPEFKVKEKMAVVDQNTNEVFGICSDNYQLYYHEEALELVEEATQGLQEFGSPIISVETLKNGARAKITALFTEVQHEIRKGDYVNPKIEIFNSYDLGWQLSSRFGAFRLVCSNGMTVGKVFSSWKKRHTLSLDPSLMRANIEGGMTLFSEQVGLWREWAERKIEKMEYDKIWEELPFSSNEREKIEALPEVQTRLLLSDSSQKREISAWDFYSVVNQYATHEVRGGIRRIEIGPEITKAFEKIIH